MGNDLLYPEEDKTNKLLLMRCRNCGYSEPAESACVHRHNVQHTASEFSSEVQDVRCDPTLPRTKEVVCEKCEAEKDKEVKHEAVFYSKATSEGMTLFFQCIHCGHK